MFATDTKARLRYLLVRDVPTIVAVCPQPGENLHFGRHHLKLRRNVRARETTSIIPRLNHRWFDRPAQPRLYLDRVEVVGDRLPANEAPTVVPRAIGHVFRYVEK